MERYGVVTRRGVINWFFDLPTAEKYAKRGDGIVRGQLVNDEGCTPYIEIVDLVTGWYENPLYSTVSAI